MATWKVAPALATGCAAILKPSELASVTSLELAEVCKEVGLPPGVLNILTGLGPEAGAPLASHPYVDKESIATKFLDRFVKWCKNIKISDPMEEGGRLGPVVSARQHEKVMKFISTAKSEGATILCGGARPQAGIVWVNCSQPCFSQAPGLENYLSVKQVTQYISDDPWGWYQSPSKL
ncbi:hypothetical protein RHGRI_024290 [Rhododendron griersonianum]|uniref:Aldehyde dehydrogenase domain-containing protein n=1 Tax=Rhododendron griersonianum TaxID=479676 RepID=A0AAV6JC74_9ERIC|nr:hypothetical protein RHGRI_024290 [Rhododendron griersonianum]